MRRHIYLTSSPLFATILACSGDPASGPTLFVGDEPKDAGQVDAGPASSSAEPVQSPPVVDVSQASDLSITFRDDTGAGLTRLSLACGACADVEAVVSGGTEPYHVVWEDQTTQAKRHVCPEASGTLAVEVSDTAVNAAEFGHPARTVQATLDVDVASCATPITEPAPGCHPDDGPRCDLGDGHVLPEDVTVDVPEATVRYFADGAPLPAGRYRIAYVDGCNSYGVGIGWSVHAQSSMPGIASCSLVDEDGPFLVAPGTELYPEMGDGEARYP